mmetsp:Transcript_30606/g.79882  ORF Transcript_30606/g.79882 Transcript_30606/m.79882 type:complete len:221 (-) Transcript_30606:1677-2339(-)
MSLSYIIHVHISIAHARILYTTYYLPAVSRNTACMHSCRHEMRTVAEVIIEAKYSIRLKPNGNPSEGGVMAACTATYAPNRAINTPAYDLTSSVTLSFSSSRSVPSPSLSSSTASPSTLNAANTTITTANTSRMFFFAALSEAVLEEERSWLERSAEGVRMCKLPAPSLALTIFDEAEVEAEVEAVLPLAFTVNTRRATRRTAAATVCITPTSTNDTSEP